MSSSVGVPTRHWRGFAVAEGTPAGEGEANAARPVIVCDCRDLPFKPDVNLSGRCGSARACTVYRRP